MQSAVPGRGQPASVEQFEIPEEWYRVEPGTTPMPIAGSGELLEVLLADRSSREIDELLALDPKEGIRRYELRSKDGRCLQITLLGHASVWLLGIRDVSLLDRLVAVLVDRDRMAAVGMATVEAAHQINNILAALNNVIPLLEHPGLTPIERAKHMRNLQREANRATELIGDLVNLGKRWREEPEPLNIERITKDVISLKQHALSAAKIAVEIEIDDAAPIVVAKRAELESALYHLIVNAIDAARESRTGEPRIGVRVSGTDAEIEIHVEDNGPGFACSVEQAFRRFFTLRENRAGLGLWIARRAIEANGGRLTIESIEERGARAMITLPRASAIQTPIEIEREDETGGTLDELQTIMGLRLLLVDDEQILRIGVSNQLRLYGPALIVEAANMNEALAAIEEAEEPFDVILLDIRLPDGTGIELYERIGKSDPGLQSRVIFMVGERVEGRLLDFLGRTGAPYVSKPFQMQQVLRSIRKVIRKQKQKR